MTRRLPFTVALTGGIAAGKSAVSRRFENLGVPVIDTDVLSREVVAPGAPALAEIVASFGPDTVLTDGSLDRKRLRQTIFEDSGARKRLESILHPRIRERLMSQLLALTEVPYALVVVPLLTENWKDYSWVDRVLLVQADLELRIQRLMARDGIDERTASAMIQAQAPDAARSRIASDTVANSTIEADLDLQVEKLHRMYLMLSDRRA